jgi:hypothetical protein
MFGRLAEAVSAAPHAVSGIALTDGAALAGSNITQSSNPVVKPKTNRLRTPRRGDVGMCNLMASKAVAMAETHAERIKRIRFSQEQ